jgi:hypothetical protein
MSSRAVAVLFGILAVSTAYDIPYPYENENYVPEELPSSTPTYMFDEADTGGYIFTHIIAVDIEWGTLFGEAVPDLDNWCPHMTDYSNHLLVVSFGAPPRLPMSLWNCTNKELVFEESDYTGVVQGK